MESLTLGRGDQGDHAGGFHGSDRVPCMRPLCHQPEASTRASGEGLPHVCQLMLGTPEAAEATEQTGTLLSAWVH
jgi:hypothetical protein